MGFSKKAKQTNTGNSDFDAEAYQAWNEHIHEQHPLKEGKQIGTKNRKIKTLIGIVNYIQDLGFPPAEDNKWKPKEEHVSPTGEEEYSQYELDYIEQHKAEGQKVDFVWSKDWDDTKKQMVTKRFQTSPADNAQEYGVCVDFPQWIVNFALHPNAKEDAPDDFRPMRVSLNGKFRQEIQRPIVFETNWKTGEVSDKNLLRKICIAADLDAELVESEWDIGTLAEATCNFKVTSDLNITDDGKCFYSASASTPSAIEEVSLPDDSIFTVDKQIELAMSKSTVAPFTGILLEMDEEEFTDDLLKMLHTTGTAHAFNKRMELSAETNKSGVKDGKEWSIDKGVDYKDTNLCKAYTKWLAKQDKKNTNSKAAGADDKAEAKSEPKSKSKPKSESKPDPKPEEKAESKPEPKPEPTDTDEGGMDFDDDIPF